MREKFFEFFKGIIIGVANVLPGFSGGVMAVAFNVYDKIIHALSNILKKPLQVIKDIWALGLGIVAGILLSIIGISILLNKFPIPTIFFFTGLIVGSVPNIYEKTKPTDKLLNKFFAFLIGFSIIVGLLIFSIIYEKQIPSGAVIGEVDLKQITILFFVGILAAATMIVPGVSGSLVLLAIGYYQYIIDFIMSFLRALFDFDLSAVLSNSVLILGFGLGIIVGALSFAKVIERLIGKHPKMFYSVVLGLLIASPFAVIYQMYIEYKEAIHNSLILNWIFGFIFLVIGVFSAIWFMTSEEKAKELDNLDIQNKE